MMRRVWLRFGTIVYWLSWPGLLLYLRGSHRTRIVVRAGGQILLVRGWLSDGDWGLPGGGLHRGEATALGAVRELREETGLEVLPNGLIELATEPLTKHGIQFLCTYFLVDVDATGITQRQRGEISELQWFHISEIGTGFQPEVHRILKLLVAKGLF